MKAVEIHTYHQLHIAEIYYWKGHKISKHFNYITRITACLGNFYSSRGFFISKSGDIFVLFLS